MKILISKKNFFKTSVPSFSITAFILSFFLLASCSEPASIETLETDQSLISKIETAAKVTLPVSDLPVQTITVFEGDLADTFIQNVQLAKDLGYVVTLGTDDVSNTDETSEVFFSKKGRKLNDNDSRRKKRRAKCFQFVFPVDFIMPDDATITLTSKEDWKLIREWYKANKDTKARPSLVFPVDVSLEDETIQTLVNREDLKEVKDSCKKGKDRKKCFKLDLPVTFTMPDATVITVSKRKDFKQVRSWHKANPNLEEKASLNFPLDIIYKDETTATINNEEELKAARKACRD